MTTEANLPIITATDAGSIHPGQTPLGQLAEPAAGDTNEDQTEIRQRKIENVSHAGAELEAGLFVLVGSDFSGTRGISG